MRIWTLPLFGLLVGSFACGGSDGTTIDGGTQQDGASNGDSGNAGNDSGSNDSGSNGNDSGMGNDSGNTDAGSFDVKNVPGLALWLDGTKDVTQMNSRVSKWGDQSGNKNDASQQLMTRQPTLVMNGINGMPTLHFHVTTGQGNFGNQLNIPDSASLDWGTGDFLIEVVGAYDNAQQKLFQDNILWGMGTFYSKQVYNSGGIGSPLAQGAALYGGAWNGNAYSTGFLGFTDTTNNIVSQNTGYNDGKARLYAVQRAGASLDLRVNGAQTDTKNVTAINLDPNNGRPNARVGCSGDANIFCLDGDIAEIIAVKGAISMSDLGGIEAYLKKKYNL